MSTTHLVTNQSSHDVLIDAAYEQHIRWEAGERLHHLFEQQVDRLVAEGRGDRLAVDDEVSWTYPELDAQANRLARHLRKRGVSAGDRVGLLFTRGVDGYITMLAALKLNAAYVPLDIGFPQDRIAYICGDAGVGCIVTHSSLVELLPSVETEVVQLDAEGATIDQEPSQRLGPDETDPPRDELAYIIYTSGSTGRPKGVAIEHAGICNFARVAAEVYGVQGSDRFYQGMTIAFDFSVEEIWVPWMVGATLVPKPPGGALVGAELSEFLLERRVTGMCCVPTLLATLDDDIPDLRFILVSGEACPQDLIARWHRPGRRFLNVYGPTEATVTATWTVLDPERRVTIGVPLPTYSIVLLDPEADRIVPHGEAGEICIGGVALSSGYVNRPDLTAKAFVEDTHRLPNNPSGRIYRTGDLGRIDEHGEVEYLGRIDLQVKIRGYRIELTEIESVLLQVPGIATAVVEPYRPEPGVVDLSAYYCRRTGADAIDPVEVRQRLRDQLPGYMVPAYFTELDAMPMLPSDKVDRKKLPPPSASQRPASQGHTAPDGPVETELSHILADVMRMEDVSTTAHFFDDLGSNSLVMARFCARVRQVPGLGTPAMKDVYRHPTVRLLAAELQGRAERVATQPTVAPEPILPPHRVSTATYVTIALAQALSFAALSVWSAFMAVFLLTWYMAADSPLDAMVRSMGVSLATFGFLFVLPIAAKWLLMGRAKVQRIPVWGIAYFRFWVIHQLTRLSPLRLAAGTPLFGWYLRLLGAKVGKGAVIHASEIPAFPDLLTIGANAVVLHGAVYSCYRVEAGIIQSGPVSIGEGAFVGGSGVLDIDTEVGAGGQLGHASSLLRGQRIPAGAHWHGVPAVPTGDDYRTVPEVKPRPLAGVLFGVYSMIGPVLLLTPALFMIVWALLGAFPDERTALLGSDRLPWDAWPANAAVVAATLLLLPLSLFAGQLFVFTVPRLVNLLVKPGRVYPLYGIQFGALRTIRRLTNAPFIALFGDSNYITGFLSRLGYSLKPIHQTGTNFGMDVAHDIPYLVRIGTGTMVSDGLTLMNAEYSSTAFRVLPTRVGRDNFFGNGVLVGPDAKIGDNVLLATKVLVPISGEVRHDTGLLGSPSFEIPRTVAQDAAFDDLKSGRRYERLLGEKLRYNTATIVLVLLSRWGFAVISGALFVGALDLHSEHGPWPLALVLFCLPVISVLYFLPLEWATQGFRRQRSQYCSLYDPTFWKHERFWKLGSNVGAGLFNGTPFKSWVLRAQGARVGRQLFDDGGSFVERSLVTVGDYCTINQGSVVQGHSLEDGTFKSDTITLGDGCTLAPVAFIHYGAHVGAGSVIESDSFLMKGEDVPPGQRWHGNPAMPAVALSLGAVPVEPRSVGSPSQTLDGPVRRPSASGQDPAGAVEPSRWTVPSGPAASSQTLLEGLRAESPHVPAPGVTVHLFSLASCGEQAAGLDPLLAHADRAALATMSSPVRRAQFAASRALVRLLLEGPAAEELAGDAPGAWWLSTQQGGAPSLHGPQPAPHISLSYSDDLVAVALSERSPVGVDLAPRALRCSELSEWVLSDAERAALAGLGNGDGIQEFWRMWALKEAAAKCLGLGASFPFAHFDSVNGVRSVSGGLVAWDEHDMYLQVRDVGRGRSHGLAIAWGPGRSHGER